MRFRTLAVASALSIGLSATGQAFAPQKGIEKPVVAAGRAPRVHRDVTWRANVAGLPGWRAQWDHDTDVPLRAWGPSIAAPGTAKDAATAEAFARSFLAQHLALLAPGAQVSDFVLAANETDPSGVRRTVAFRQRFDGLDVVGGGIGFLFAHDHLVMTSSTALPNVSVKVPDAGQSAQKLEDSAAAFLAKDGYKVRTRGHGTRVVLPLVRPRGNAAAPAIEYRVVETVSMEAVRGAGRWDVWLDAADAAPVARHTTLSFATGTVQYNVPDRYPTSTRSNQPAPFATHQINGAAVTAAIDGTVTWATASPAALSPGLSGTYAAITNVAGSLVATTLSLTDGGTAVWDQSSNDQADAQLDAYVFENTVKHFVLTTVNPNLTWAKGVISVNVNENMTCNAFSTGDDIHFFQKDTMCENTGRIADVVYHETGHSVHFNSIIPGQGAFDGSLSEGLADTLAIAITGDHGLGRGFFFNDMPLRDVAPATPKVWPKDADGEPHDEGEIIGEALWDTRVALETKLGQAAGYAQFIKIYYNIVQRAADIPSSYAEALAADDDDGDLSNGTPNECEIDTAFGRHGLADPKIALGLTPPARDNFTISFTLNPPAGSSCATTATVQSAVIDWNPRGATGGEIPITASGSTWSGQIPTQPDGTVVEYRVTITMSDGSLLAYPDNPADPLYQFYVGTPTVIQCWDFEQGLGQWTHAGTPSTKDEWEVGAPLGINGDPKSAHGGQNVLGIDLGSDDGLYSSRTKQYAQSPMVDLGGATNVHLQYWRWLGVEDGIFDHATIYANGQFGWTNLASSGMAMNAINHVDREWRFQDVDLSAQTASGQMQIKFELDSDPGVEFSGWTIDDVCLVAIPAAGPPPGDDAGTTGPGAMKTGGGCCSASGGPGGSALLALGTIVLVLRRRREARAV